MNKKQLLEAVELMRATYSADEIHRMANEQYIRRRYDPPDRESPLEEHIVWIATYNGSGKAKYAITEAMAAYHSVKPIRWLYWARVSGFVPGLFTLAGLVTLGVSFSLAFGSR